MPLRPSSGSSGIRTPWKSWLVSLRPLSENCPTDIFSSRGILPFRDDGSLLAKRDPSASQDQAAARDDDRECASAEALRFGAVLTWVVYSVSPVKARPPTRLPTTDGISFQKM